MLVGWLVCLFAGCCYVCCYGCRCFNNTVSLNKSTIVAEVVAAVVAMFCVVDVPASFGFVIASCVVAVVGFAVVAVRHLHSTLPILLLLRCSCSLVGALLMSPLLLQW